MSRSTSNSNGTSTEASYASRICDLQFKVLIVGESGVGKSAFAQKLTDGSFSDDLISTIGVEFRGKRLVIDENLIGVTIWDTAGQERFRSITNSFYRGASGILIGFDLTDSFSFSRVKNWLEDIAKFTQNKSISIILVGMKSDLTRNRVIEYSEAKNVAQSLGIEYMEASAKTGAGVDEVFQSLCEKMVKSCLPSTQWKEKSRVTIKSSETKNSSFLSWCSII